MPQEPLAIHGGDVAVPDGPPEWPLQDAAVKRALNRAFNDGSWGSYHGPHCARLTDTVQELHAIDHAFLVASGTVAVELALRAGRVEPGDEVILAGYDFPGNFRAIEAVGATPVLVDIDPQSWCIDVQRVEEALSSQTRAVIVSHLHGGLAEIWELCALAAEKGLTVVEDACQATAALIDGRMAGTWGDVGVLSFGGSKLLTAGRGGALLTQKSDLLQRVKVFSERGNQAFPMSELQAAVLPPQIAKLQERHDLRLKNARQLIDLLRDLPCLIPVDLKESTNSPSLYKLAWRLDESAAGFSREAFVTAIRAEGVALDAGFRGFTRRSSRRCRRSGTLEHSQRAADQTVILHHPVLLTDSTIMEQVSLAIRKVIGGLAS